MFHLGSIRGTTMRVDFSFLLLVLLFAAINYNRDAGIHYALIWIPIVFVSILFHELAHAAMIGLLGFGPSEIVLMGMGGVTYNRRKAKPWQDLLISIAGPLSSFALMFLCAWLYTTVPYIRQDAMLAALLPRMVHANYLWAIFNLIPVAPLDGGHAVREFFGIFLPDRKAFVVYVWIAMIAGGAIVLWSIRSRNYFIALFIGFLVYRAYDQWQHFRRYGTPGD